MLLRAVSLAEIGTIVVLGLMFGMFPGLLLSGVHLVPLPLALYASSVSLAHLFEYLFVCSYHCDELSWASFLINYSKDYTLAHCAALIEYVVEFYLVPSENKL